MRAYARSKMKCFRTCVLVVPCPAGSGPSEPTFIHDLHIPDGQWGMVLVTPTGVIPGLDMKLG